MRSLVVFCAVLILLIIPPGRDLFGQGAADWTQWGGPHRDFMPSTSRAQRGVFPFSTTRADLIRANRPSRISVGRCKSMCDGGF